MDGQTPQLAISDEVNRPADPIDPKWLKLLEKLANHPRKRNLILLPEEVELLTSKLLDMTEQLVGLMGFINKYTPLMNQIAEVENSVRARQAEAAATDDRSTSDPEGDAADRGERSARVPAADPEEPE